MANDRTNVRLVKVDAAISIAALIRERGLTIAEAAKLADMEAVALFGIMVHGQFDGISLERLDKIVEALEAAPENKPPGAS